MYLKESHEAEKHAIHGTEPAEVESKAIQPLFGTKEWAPYSENCVVGCSHDCRYCYAKAMAIHYERSTPQEWKNEKLRPNILQKKFHKRGGDYVSQFPRYYARAFIRVFELPQEYPQSRK